MKNFHSAQKGFTLIEFMIAAVLGLLVLLAVGGIYVATQRVNETAAARVNRQQELRMVGNLLIRDARMAGTFGCANLGALANDGFGFDQQATRMVFNSDPSYFAFEPPLAEQRVYSTRMMAATAAGGGNSAVMNTINAGFAPVPNSQIIIFNYGSQTQPLLTTTLTGVNTLNTLTVEDVSTFSATNNAAARVVLASCGRVDVLHRSQLRIDAKNRAITINNAATLNIPMYKTGITYRQIPNAGQTNTDSVHYASQATLSNLHTVAYVVGNIAGVNQPPALYRFEILDGNGTWSPPQLLAKNIASLVGQYIYTANCPIASGAAAETFNVGTDAFIADASGNVMTPTGIMMTLTPTVTNMDVANNAAVTSATDLMPIVFNATMRGANTCATR